MEKRKNKSYWVILILLFIIFICSFLLYKNITAGAKENDNEIIGTLTFKHKTIERKYDSDVIWAKIESGLIIRNKDTIRSGDFSDAVLTLKDDTKININENSMIYLDISNNDINLNFAYGSMSLSKNDKGDSAGVTVKIKSGSNTVEVKNSDLVLEKKGREELSFQVKKGTAKLKSGNEEKEVKTNESAKLKDSEIEISEIHLNLITPEDASIVSENSNSIPVKFQWESTNSKNIKLEIAIDSRFKNIYKSFNVANESFATNLSQGNYYWRVSSEANKKKKKSIREYSSFRKLTVYSTLPPTLISPKMNQVFSYLTSPPIIAFNWKKLETAKNFRLEISKNSSFTELVKSINTNQSSVGLDTLDAGKYFAKLIAEPIRQEFKQETSEVISFSVEKKTNLDPPLLINPKNNLEINSLVFSKSGFIFQAKDNAEITDFLFQISSSQNFEKIILEKNSNSNQVRFQSNLETGQYFWRVIGIAANGQKTPNSEPRKFQIREDLQIELLSPKNNSMINLKENPVLFRWNRLSYKANFKIEISESPDFKEKIYAAQTNEFSSSFSLSKEGKYYWQILSLAEDNSILSKSSVQSFQIHEANELIPIYPSMNERVDMSPVDSINFKWESNTKVEGYYFELYKEQKKNRTLIAKIKTKSNHFTFKDLSKLDEGNFSWTLQEFFERSGENQLGKKITITFKIYLSAKPGSPEIITPKKMYVE